MRAIGCTILLATALSPYSAMGQTPPQQAHVQTPDLRDVTPEGDALQPVGPERLPSPSQQELEGERSSGVTLEELENIAFGNNPAIAEAAAQVQAARGRWTQVGLYPNPQIGYAAEEIGSEGTAGLQGGFVSQEIVRGGKLQLNREVACRQIMQAQAQLEAQRFRVSNDVRLQFYAVLVAQRTLQLTRDLRIIGEQGTAAAKSLLEAKRGSLVDLLQARVEANSARIALENAQNEYTGAWRRLALTIGTPEMQPVELAGDLEGELPDLAWEDALGRLMAESPELAAARAEVERARWTYNRAVVEPIPNLNVQAGVQYDNGSGDTVTNLQLAIPLPIHNRNQGAIRQAQAELSAAEAQLYRVELNLRDRLAVVFVRYANARNQVNRYAQEILPDAKQSLELMTSGYRQGEFNFLALLTSQRTYFQTNLAYLSALRDLWESTVEIDGLLLTGSLANGASGVGPLEAGAAGD